MQQTIDTNTTSCLSRNRIQAVAAFYYPLLRWQIILYPIVAVLMYVLSVLLSRIPEVNGLSTTPGTIVEYMFYLAPLVLTRRDCRMVETMLPATALEKAIVIVGYFFIIVPIISYGVYNALVLIRPYGILDTTQDLFDFDKIYYPVIMRIGVALVSLIPAATCLLTVMTAKRNRTLKGIIYPILSAIALGIIAAIYAVIYVFCSGILDNNLAFNKEIPDISCLVNHMLYVCAICGLLSLCYAVACIFWIYRVIKNRQIV